MKRAYRTGAAVVVAGGLLASSQALATGQVPVTPEQASAAALGVVAGTVLEVELETERGQTLYEVEIRPAAGGRVVEVMVDPTTGAVLGTETDDDDLPGGGSDD
jgi:uncharacterized membrane protein YkoI